MFAPPFITPRATAGEAARTRALLIRAGSVAMVLWWLPPLTGAFGEVAHALFVEYDESLRRPGAGGYLYLYFLRLADMDLLGLLRREAESLLGVGAGLVLLLRRYRGPCWGEVDA